MTTSYFGFSPFVKAGNVLSTTFVITGYHFRELFSIENNIKREKNEKKKVSVIFLLVKY